jgi:hypothetical protein
MNKILKGAALAAVLGMAMIMTGCGDDDDNGGGGQQAPANVSNPQGRTFNVTYANGDTATIAFASGGAYTLNTVTAADGTTVTNTETGTYAFSSSSPTNSSVTLTPANGAAGQRTVVIMSYPNAGATGGTFTSTFSPGNGGADVMNSGSFTSNDTPSGGNPNPDPGNGGNNGGGNTNGVPTSLQNQHLQLTFPAAGEFINFNTATSFTGEIANGNYTWTPGANNTGQLHVTFTDPAANAGEFYDLTLTFTSATSGTVTGNQHYENADHQVSGTFALTPL